MYPIAKASYSLSILSLLCKKRGYTHTYISIELDEYGIRALPFHKWKKSLSQTLVTFGPTTDDGGIKWRRKTNENISTRKKRLNAIVKRQNFFRLLYLYFYIQYFYTMLCCVRGYSGPSSGRVFIIIRVLFVVFSLLLSSAERRIKYIRRRRIFRLCWHWGLRASNSRSPPTRHTSSEST